MKFLKLKNLAMVGALSVAGVGLIGVGTHATFFASTTDNQQITAGTAAVALTSPDANCTLVSQGCTTITLPNVGPTGSSFTSGDQTMTVTNTGNVNLTEMYLLIGSTYPTSALATEAYICVASTGIGTGGTPYLLYNGPISGLPTTPGWSQGGDMLTTAGTTPTSTSAPTDNWIYNVYSGPAAASPCGFTNISPSTGLNNDAMGNSITLSATMTYQG